MKSWGHTVIGVIFYLLLLRIFEVEFLNSFLMPFFIIISVCGSLFPDIDLVIMRSFKGFGHRNMFTHSALLPLISSLLIFTLLEDVNLIKVLKLILFPFLAGISSHLFADLTGGGRVKGLKGGKYWLIINGMLSLPFLTFYIGEILSKILKPFLSEI